MHDLKLKSWSFPLKGFLQKWPLVQQILNRGNGTGVEAMSEETRNLKARIHGTKVARSICPYCAVGCGQLIHHKNGKLVSIEGDPASPISRGHLCPKGSASFELLTHPNRLTKVLYRKPRSKEWEALELESAMDMVAERVWEAREKTFEETRDGQALMQKKWNKNDYGGKRSEEY